jgi:hypothetical protein
VSKVRRQAFVVLWDWGYLEHNISVRKFWGIFICFACGLWKSEAKRSNTGGSDSLFLRLKKI